MAKYNRERIVKLLLFYLIFYAVLVIYFGISFFVFYQTLSDKRPKWILEKSLIGTNPAMDFRPIPVPYGESTLIRYRINDYNSTQFWKKKLDEFLKPYFRQKGEGPYVYCEPGEAPPSETNAVCIEPINDLWYPCTSANNYSYSSNLGGPCIFLKFNKIYGWKPEYYTTSNMIDDIPGHIKSQIFRIEDQFGPNSNKLKVVWVSCEGENPIDAENLGPIMYFPKMGFDGQYFPFLNADGYLSPLVAVHFQKPAHGVMINVECKAWAKNIIHNRIERRGLVHFKLLLDY